MKRFINSVRANAGRLTTVATGFFLTCAAAHADTVFDRLGDYTYQGFTGKLAQGISVPILVASCAGLAKGEGRVKETAFYGAIASGGVLAAPKLSSEFKGVVGGLITLFPSLQHVHLAIPFLN